MIADGTAAISTLLQALLDGTVQSKPMKRVGAALHNRTEHADGYKHKTPEPARSCFFAACGRSPPNRTELLYQLLEIGVKR